ncbi:hypothetical protein [Gimesia panareensis]|uniref:hypothetical protein n=1 Tax=Gimesia panareensis TaxID=2527978 RepID=UPI001189588A|nr:hypothetical protein [Gimesia panareensis]QDU47755.1 hypothetical protein Pan110_00650 [Gimesia panareensis]
MTDPVQLTQFQLIPVLELEPGTFSTQDRVFPYEEGKDQTNEEQEHWDSCLADSGITNLTPIKTGSWFVRATVFSDEQLDQYLRVIFADWGGIHETLDDPDCLPELPGGFVLLSQTGEVLVEPTCCCSLKDLENWEAAAQNRSQSWQTLWVGHPWISTRFQTPWVILSDYHELEMEIPERWVVRRQELQQAIQNAERELTQFSLKLERVLEKWALQTDLKKLARQLVCLPENDERSTL